VSEEYNPDIHHRHSIRYKNYDYSQAGAYFVTLCVLGKECLLGKIDDGEMQLNALGEIVRDEWLRTEVVRPYVLLDAFVVMPNHFHGIIVLTTDRARMRVASTMDVPLSVEQLAQGRPSAYVPGPVQDGPRGAASGSLGAIIGQFKSITAKRINLLGGTPGRSVWQRDYYERIIRNEREMNGIRQYIAYNPAHWSEDDNNPENVVSC
jgi:REP element-mobilizing transposase RayT